MKKTLILIVLLLIGLWGCLPRTGQKKNDFVAPGVVARKHPKGKFLTIIYSNTTNGVLRSCGCPGNPYGGLAQRSSVINTLRKRDPELLLFDSGDILSAMYLPGNQRDRDKGRHLFEAYQEMKYDAIGVGDQELILGIDYFNDIRKSYKLPFTSSTLFTLPDKERLGKEHRFFTRKGLTVAVTSVIGPKTFFFFPQKQLIFGKLIIQEPNKILNNQIAGYKEVSDLIVVLSHLGVDADKKLAEDFPDIDVIIGGHSQTLIEEPIKVGNTIIVQAGGSGERLGKLVIGFNKQKEIVSVSNMLIPLNEQIPPEPRVQAIVDDFYALERKQTSPEAIAKMAAQKKYQYPALNCAACHLDEAKIWSASAHSKSFNSLLEPDRTDEPGCLYCHVSGFGYGGGYISQDATKKMAAVTCLSCHLAATRDHLKISSLAFTEKKKICLGCHTVQKSPDFDYDAYWSRIKH